MPTKNDFILAWGTSVDNIQDYERHQTVLNLIDGLTPAQYMITDDGSVRITKDLYVSMDLIAGGSIYKGYETDILESEINFRGSRTLPIYIAEPSLGEAFILERDLYIDGDLYVSNNTFYQEEIPAEYVATRREGKFRTTVDGLASPTFIIRGNVFVKGSVFKGPEQIPYAGAKPYNDFIIGSSNIVNGAVKGRHLDLSEEGIAIGIGTLVPEFNLDVRGTVNSTIYYEHGVPLSNLYVQKGEELKLSTDQLTNGILPIERGGTGTSEATGTGKNVYSISPSFTGVLSAQSIEVTSSTGDHYGNHYGVHVGQHFGVYSGDGSGLSNVTALAIIPDYSISNVKMANNSIATNNLQDLSVTTFKLEDLGVTTQKVADYAITDMKLAANSVTNAKLAANAVTTTKLIDNAITTSKLADNAITEPKIVNGAVTMDKIANGSVVQDKISDNSVSESKLKSNSVTTDKIANQNVTSEKLALNVVEDKSGWVHSGSTVRLYQATDSVGIGTATPLASTHLNHDFHIAANGGTWNSTAKKGLFMRYSTNSGQDSAYIQSIDRSTVTHYPLGFNASSYTFARSSPNPTTMSVISDENSSVILNLSSPNGGNPTLAKKTAIISEGINSWGRGKLHFCLNDNPFNNSAVEDVSLAHSRMTITNDGLVGIGATNPNYKFQITNTKTQTYLLDVFNYNNVAYNTANTGYNHLFATFGLNNPIFFYVGSTHFYMVCNDAVNSVIRNTSFYKRVGGVYTLITQDADLAPLVIGVNTITHFTNIEPFQILDAYGVQKVSVDNSFNLRANQAYIGTVPDYGDAYATFSHKDKASSGNYGMLHTNWGQTILNSAAGYGIDFRINNGSKMFLDPNGNLGLAISPSFKLDVNGDLNVRSHLRLYAPTYSTFWRNDNSDTYLLVTNANDPNGGWNGYRPFKFSHATGQVIIGNILSTYDTGSVGIGVLNHEAKLHVQDGNIMAKCTVDGPPTAALYTVNASAGASAYALFVMKTDSPNPFVIFKNSSTRGADGGVQTTTIRNDDGNLRVQASGAQGILIEGGTGNVGIGTESPSHKLHVNGQINISSVTASDTSLFVMRPNLTANTRNNLTVGQSTTTNNTANLRFTYAGAGSTGNYLGVGFWGNDDILNVAATGSVGIGVAAPTTKLDVVSATPIIKVRDATGGGGWLHFGNAGHGIGRNTQLSTLTDVNDVTVHTAGSGSLGFVCGSTPVERMRINAAGDVGIGTNNPTSMLQVQGNIRVVNSGAVSIMVGATTSTGLRMGSVASANNFNTGTAVGDCVLRMDDGTKKLHISTGNAAPTMTLSSGSVGVGTLTPLQKMHVQDGNMLVTLPTTVSAGWRNFLIEGTSLWGDGLTTASEFGGTLYGTVKSFMFQNPHVVTATVGGSARIRYGRAGGVSTGTWWETATRADGKFHIVKEATDYTGIIIDTTGKVGIGNLAPAQRLDVEGNVKAETFLTNNGTNSLPAYSFVGDTDTGMYQVTANGIGFATGGVERVRVTSEGIAIPSTGVGIDLGFGRTREPNAGKIGYAQFTPNTLDIVGAGVTGVPRAIKLWDNVTVGTNLNVNGTTTSSTMTSTTGNITTLNSTRINATTLYSTFDGLASGLVTIMRLSGTINNGSATITPQHVGDITGSSLAITQFSLTKTIVPAVSVTGDQNTVAGRTWTHTANPVANGDIFHYQWWDYLGTSLGGGLLYLQVQADDDVSVYYANSLVMRFIGNNTKSVIVPLQEYASFQIITRNGTGSSSTSVKYFRLNS